MTGSDVPLSRFLDSLDTLDVEWTLATIEEFDAALCSVTTEPAVGATLQSGLSLPAYVQTDPTPAELRTASTGVTAATMGIADYGSIVVTASADGTEPVSLFPDRHVAVLRAAAIVPDMPAAFTRLGPELRQTGGSAILATGPSATADMGALVRGAHGPSEVHVVVVEEGR